MRGEFPVAREQRKLAAILAADVVGYSRLMGRDESGTLARLREHRSERLEPAVARYGGRLVKLTGDGALIEFASAVDALNAAIEFQQAMAAANMTTSEERITFRVGIHVGDVIVDGEDLYGDGVNIAARLEGESPTGGVIISGNTRDLVGSHAGVRFRDRGVLSLKNIDRPVRAYEVELQTNDGADEDHSKRHEVPEIGQAPSGPSIAVRPFTVLAEDRELGFLAEGLAEDVISLLARTPGFLLISKASSFVFRDPETPTAKVARQLGVRYVVEGSLRGAGERVRARAHLVEAATGRVLWSGQFEAARAEAFDLQDDIARGIIVELEPALNRAEIAVIRRQRPENIDAWGFYRQGAGALADHGWNEKAVAAAADFLQRAIDLDVDFSLARAQLALLWALAHDMSLIERSEETRRRALAAAERAIADDPGSSEVLGYAGCAVTDLGQTERGTEILRQAVEIDPSNAQAQVALGAAIGRAGDFEGGIALMRHGIRLSPRDRRLGIWSWALGTFLLRCQRPVEALEEARIAARRDPRLYLAPILEAAAHANLGRTDLAQRHLAAARRLRPALSLDEIEITHGKRAARALAEAWKAGAQPT
jgi:adenylate cyclase